jgi:hypothetical protein
MMALPSKDWIFEAAQEISDGIDGGWPSGIADIIRKHFPFKDFTEGVAYMPVPRCETCKHWEPIAPFNDHGRCLMVDSGEKKMWASEAVNESYEGIETTLDFGCVQWEAK